MAARTNMPYVTGRWLDAPPDRRIFIKPVFQVNAYALPVWNEIGCLAAIARPPFVGLKK